MVQAGKIDCIIVRDLSRFGRNSIETGYFIERVFHFYHTRFIFVSDDFDTANFKRDTGGIKGKTIIMCPGHTASGPAVYRHLCDRQAQGAGNWQPPHEAKG